MQGGTQIKEKFPEAVLVFIMPPSAKELRRRLIGRGTETSDVIEARLKRAKEEAHWMDEYDYLLINENVDDCVEQLHSIIQCQHFRPVHESDFTNKRRIKPIIEGDQRYVTSILQSVN